MTTFNEFLSLIGYGNLKSKTIQELENYLTCIYIYCDNKYGKVPGDYFLEGWKGNGKIKRGSEGLDVHHKYEYDPNNGDVCSLSELDKAKMWFNEGYTEYQKKENLVYCNWVEHQIIHMLIDTLRTRHYGSYRPGCVERRAPMFAHLYNNDDFFEEHKDKKHYCTVMHIVQDELDIDTYRKYMFDWAEANDIEDWMVFGAEDTLENCFEIDWYWNEE